MLSGKITAKLCNAGIDKEKILQLDEYFEEFPQHYKFANQMFDSIRKHEAIKINDSDEWLKQIHCAFLSISSTPGALLTTIAKTNTTKRKDHVCMNNHCCCICWQCSLTKRSSMIDHSKDKGKIDNGQKNC